MALNPENAARLEAAIRTLGFNPPGLDAEWFLRRGSGLRIGQEPLRFDIINDIDGVTFAECYARRVVTHLEEVKVNLISLPDLKTNKKASGRNKDLADLHYMP